MAAGSQGASDRERREAERLATGLPLQYLTEAKAPKVLVRDLYTGKMIGLIRRWSERLGLLSDRPLYFRGQDTALLEVTIYASDGFLDHNEWKGEPDYREFCVPPADLKTRIISIHLMSLEEQHEASRRMLREVVPLVLTPSNDLSPATQARLLEFEKRIDELERVFDLDAIFSNSKELGSLGCAGQ